MNQLPTLLGFNTLRMNDRFKVNHVAQLSHGSFQMHRKSDFQLDMDLAAYSGTRLGFRGIDPAMECALSWFHRILPLATGFDWGDTLYKDRILECYLDYHRVCSPGGVVNAVATVVDYDSLEPEDGGLIPYIADCTEAAVLAAEDLYRHMKGSP